MQKIEIKLAGTILNFNTNPLVLSYGFILTNFDELFFRTALEVELLKKRNMYIVQAPTYNSFIFYLSSYLYCVIYPEWNLQY